MVTKDSKERGFSQSIEINFPWELPKRISGPAVMFDVVAASRNIIHAVRDAKAVNLATGDSVFDVLRKRPEAVLLGESPDPRLKDKFAATNSASAIAKADISGKKVIILTNNGTHTVSELVEKGAAPVAVGHYANMEALVNWIRKNNFPRLTLVPSGGREPVFADNPNLTEDRLCAEAVRDMLLGRKVDFDKQFADSLTAMREEYPELPIENDLNLIFTIQNQYTVIPVVSVTADGLLAVENALV